MSRVDEVRAELGEDNVNELMDAYYTSGLSLNDLRELYDLPKSFADEKIVELFPMIELDDGCPLCGGALFAPRISRGIKDVSADSYYKGQVFCPNCGKTRQQAMRELEEFEQKNRLRRAFSREPKEFEWAKRNPDSLTSTVFEVLIEVKGMGGNTYLRPIADQPLLFGFIDACKALRGEGYIQPTAAFDEWLSGFEEQEDGFVFYWYEVPFAIKLEGYTVRERNPIIVEGDREYVSLGQGEREYWLRTAKGLVLAYLDAQLDNARYEYEGPKREEFETLLDTMLLEYSPAQITSLIWNAMAAAEKHAEEGPAYKRTGNWAMGVVLNLSLIHI